MTGPVLAAQVLIASALRALAAARAMLVTSRVGPRKQVWYAPYALLGSPPRQAPSHVLTALLILMRLPQDSVLAPTVQRTARHLRGLRNRLAHVMRATTSHRPHRGLHFNVRYA
jgi:hypothetical protein